MAFPWFIRHYPMPEKFDGELNLVYWRLDKDEGQHQPEGNINDIALLLITFVEHAQCSCIKEHILDTRKSTVEGGELPSICNQKKN